jgi:hypothetical protein
VSAFFIKLPSWIHCFSTFFCSWAGESLLQSNKHNILLFLPFCISATSNSGVGRMVECLISLLLHLPSMAGHCLQPLHSLSSWNIWNWAPDGILWLSLVTLPSVSEMFVDTDDSLGLILAPSFITLCVFGQVNWPNLFCLSFLT